MANNEKPATPPTDESAYRTERGFHGYLQLTDSYDNEVRVQESSAAMAPHVWLSIDGKAHLHETPQPLAGLTYGLAQAHISSHLSVEQARRVRDALDAWLDEVDQEQVTATIWPLEG